MVSNSIALGIPAAIDMADWGQKQSRNTFQTRHFTTTAIDSEGRDDGFLVEWAGRYDTVLGLPVVGETNVFVGYRGGYFENEGENLHYLDHTVMAGFKVWFGGNSLMEFDRVGATLDAPNFGRWVGSGNIID